MIEQLLSSVYTEVFHAELKRYTNSAKRNRNRPEFARKKEQGRNEKCVCGSGKKYKNCCGK